MERKQLIIIFLFIVTSSSAADDTKDLLRTVGGNITFRHPVMQIGFLTYKGKILSMVMQGKLEILEHTYSNRLHWENNTGFFRITDLQKNDSGIYSIDSKKDGSVTSYKLAVYDRVPTPVVKTLSVNPESCVLLCSVDKAEDTTLLLWYKDEEVVNRSSSALSLPLTVHKDDFNSSYRCAAESPVEENIRPVNIVESCGQTQEDRKDSNRNYITLTLVPILLAAAVLCVAFIVKQKYLVKKEGQTIRQTQGPDETETRDVLYTQVQIRKKQPEHTRESPGTAESGSQLKTVYDKLEVHRTLPQYTELSYGNHDDKSGVPPVSATE